MCDLLEVGDRLDRERFDVCLFKGIFYHLPDPVAGLKIVADRTDEVLVLDTAAVSGHEDGFLKIFREGAEHPMSGVHHLAWRPTGPGVLASILEWLGFPATHLVSWRRHAPPKADLGRLRIVAARDPAMLVPLARPPATSVLVPDDGATLSGTCPLDAGVSNGVVEVSRLDFHLSGEHHDDVVLGAATPTMSGWIYMWDTTAVPNATYRLTSVAVDVAGATGRSDPITVRVRN